MDKIVDLERLTSRFPDNAIQSRIGGGGKSLRYVATHTVIHRLNDATGNRWDFRITRLEWHADLLIATGELTLTGLGTRTGIGVQKVSERGGEDLVKGASSDCLKKCATLFGVALELYGPDYEDEDFTPANARPAARPSTETKPAPRRDPAPPPPANGNGGRKKMPVSDTEIARIAAVVEAGGGSTLTPKFLGWLASNTPNNAGSLQEVNAEDVEPLIAKLEAIAKQRNGQPQPVIPPEDTPPASSGQHMGAIR